MKRILLFLATNLAIVLTVSLILNLLGIGGYLGPNGQPTIPQLAVFCFIWGMVGSFISLQISRWVAKRAMGVELVDGRTGNDALDWLKTRWRRSPDGRICRCLRWASIAPAR